MYFAGEELNEQDFNLNKVSDPEARNSLIVTLRPAEELESGAMMGVFDIVLTHGGRYDGSS
jgi:protocatechuate 3,4-dioxygenase beta subunit